jgi:glycerate kinase
MTTGPAVLIACDKFKGTLTAAEACNAICEGIKSVWADASCFSRPMADGGEGTARVICEACGGEWLTEEVTGPLADRVTGGRIEAAGLGAAESVARHHCGHG